MNTFAIGELAEFIGTDPVLPWFRGMECTVTGPLELREYHFVTGTRRAMAYEVKSATGEVGPCQPQLLRKKRPPSEPLARWEDIPYFNPTKETVS